MESHTAPLFFIGAMPPPVHGASNVNARMFEALGQGQVNVHLFDIARGRVNKPGETRSPGDQEGELRKFARFFRSMASAPGRKTTYLSISGGLGQVRDLLYIAISRIFCAKIYVHHHSFAYLNKRKLVTRLCVLAAGPRSDHIVLCDRMAMLLSQQYRIRRERISCLSNAAFLPISGNTAARQTLKTVSFLSNITFEKGIATFVELANELHARGVPVQCRIAGPAAPEVQGWLDDALAKAPYIEYLGAQYGADKKRFLEQTDLLVFPSAYANEAEPVTILEAFSFGIPTIATALGCIPGLVAEERGFVLDTQACTAAAIADLIAQLTKDQPAYQCLSANCSAYIEKSSAVHSAALNEIVGAIQRGGDFGAPP